MMCEENVLSLQNCVYGKYDYQFFIVVIEKKGISEVENLNKLKWHLDEKKQ